MSLLKPLAHSSFNANEAIINVMDWVKSRQRVADHGEVFTPPELAEAMIGLVEPEVSRIDSRVLEPACGCGSFLVLVLARKLDAVDRRYGRSEFEARHHALLALMSIYGIELLEDNVAECRASLLGLYAKFLQVTPDDPWYAAARNVLGANVVHGDALSMTTRTSMREPIMFAEWAYVGKGIFRRRDFRYDTLTQMSSFGDDTLFGDLGKHEIFIPSRDHGALSVTDIARSGSRDD